ncbi:uncharacterized protein LOC125947359 [Dermacentor silvarum]|uniref:uncharacterized protein LOC125947359 n=1 Tax=Dermacentor silvarum TaxID=543639 RepID=UPI002101582F|nr:uncharacterized protein LOC125947359 [Dermacentor silvarum]
MAAATVFAFIAFFSMPFVFGKLGPPGGPQHLHHDAIDAFKIIENFQFTVAITDSDNDTIFECVAGNRTEIDPEAKTATFVWLFQETENSPREDIPFYVKVADEPETITFTVDDDPTIREGRYYYTDYETCVVLDMEYHGHQCILWTKLKVKDAVPQHCIDHFVDACGVIVPQHSRDLCPDGEGDY